MKGYGKLIWPVLGLVVMAVLTTVQEAMADHRIDAQEWVLVIFQALMAINVWATANLPGYERMKTVVSATIAVVAALHVFIVGGVSTPELVNLSIVFFAALGVAFTPQPLTITQNGHTVPPQDRALGRA